ncbi:hypothetical protein PICMEDRAFT_165460 [Pichia membranifaciens NRRL Y-2026]|uniref:Uncharacterized protein n=1 Tax=Pichia membranifaciens NRRL Y-2026 TaxID=763406 RepID=A0A1E3NG02_9ASCO|nr:hypothetical protein PICMEDRAFT_165460 [Pichia membranifaciens NRRL Y-2026]ODQ45061.1 hypothetical protein PICMEDRAFT_165460 [Pichia membranifaciens NRRL Y-2026]
MVWPRLSNCPPSPLLRLSIITNHGEGKPILRSCDIHARKERGRVGAEEKQVDRCHLGFAYVSSVRRLVLLTYAAPTASDGNCSLA